MLNNSLNCSFIDKQPSFGINLTVHARQRLNERPITFQEMKKIVNKTNESVSHINCPNESVVHHFGITENKHLAEVIEGIRDGCRNIVTVIVHSPNSFHNKVKKIYGKKPVQDKTLITLLKNYRA